MCRNIKNLFNFDPPVTSEEIHASSLQFVRKISGCNKPSKANEAAFQTAVDEVTAISTRLLRSLETSRKGEGAQRRAVRDLDQFPHRRSRTKSTGRAAL